jgi:hypothetical protein
MTEEMARKRFVISGRNASASLSKLLAPDNGYPGSSQSGVLTWAGARPVSRRDFMRTAAAGGVALTGLAGLTPAARAEPVTLTIAACILSFLGKVMVPFVAGIGAGLVLDRIRNARYEPRNLDAVPQNSRFHFEYAAPERTDLVVPATQTRYENCYFDLRQNFRIGSGNNLGQFQDLNIPEVLRFEDELPADGTYRPISDARGATRRRLNNREREQLFPATLRLYARDGGIPRNAIITPIYVRELTDARGRRYLGFGLTQRSGQESSVNFLISDRINDR